MKIATLLLLITLLTFNSCKKNKDKTADKPKSTLTLLNEGKSYELEVTDKVLTLGDTSEIRLFANSPQMMVELHALSLDHQSGVGEYYLRCCNNDFWEKFGITVGYEGNRPLTDGGKQVGFLRITKKEGQYIEGSFSLNGKNSDNVSKEITGTFKIYL